MKTKIFIGCFICIFLISCTTSGPKHMYTTDSLTGEVIVPVEYVGGLDALNKKTEGKLFVTNSLTKFVSDKRIDHFNFPTSSITGVYVGDEVKLHFGKALARWMLVGPFTFFIKDKSEVIAIEFTDEKKSLVFNPIFQIKVGTGAMLKKNILFKQRVASEKMDWETAAKANTITAYEEFLKKHSSSKYESEARTRMKTHYAKRDFKNAQDADSYTAYEQYLKKHPDSEFADEARSRLNALKELSDWESAQKVDSIRGYNQFIALYPTSQYVTKAKAKISEHEAAKKAKHTAASRIKKAKTKPKTKPIQKDVRRTELKSSMPTPRMAITSASVDGKIYIFGGFTKRGKSTSLVEEYDSATNKWTQKTSMPTRRGMAAAVALDKLVYVVGGRNENGITTAVDVYDTGRNSWKKVKPLPASRWNHMLAVSGGKIYVIGGISGVGNRRECLTTVEIYDPAKDTWSTGCSLPTPKQGAAVSVVNGKIYIIGGRTGAGNSGYAKSSVDVYDPIKNTWSEAKSMKSARTSAQSAVVYNKIYVIGGAARDKATTSIDVYDPTADKWTAKYSMQKPRSGHSVNSVGNKIYIIGGAVEPSVSGITGIVEELTLEGSTAPVKTVEPGAMEAKTKETQASRSEAVSTQDAVILQDHPTATHVAKVIPYGREKLLTLSEPKVKGNMITMSYKWEKEGAKDRDFKGIAYVRGASLVPGASVTLFLHKGWNFRISKNEVTFTINHDLRGTARIAIFFVNEEDMSPNKTKGLKIYKALSNVVFVDFEF